MIECVNTVHLMEPETLYALIVYIGAMETFKLLPYGDGYMLVRPLSTPSVA